jgi:hypothetical protein
MSPLHLFSLQKNKIAAVDISFKGTVLQYFWDRRVEAWIRIFTGFNMLSQFF